MESNLSLKFFYENVMNDYKSIIQMFASDKGKRQIDEIKDICKFCFNFLNAYPVDNNKNIEFILNLIKNYIDEINQYFKNEEIFNNEMKVNEHDIYKAYGLLWGLEYIFSNSEENEISEFKYKKYKNFSCFLEKYGSYRILSKNYKSNFREEINNKPLNINFIRKWLEKLDVKGLHPLKKKVKTSKITKNDDAKQINGLNNKESNNNPKKNDTKIQEEEKQVQYNIEEENKTKISTDIENINLIKEKTKNEHLIKEKNESQSQNNNENSEISKNQIITSPNFPPKNIINLSEDEVKMDKEVKDKEHILEDDKIASINNNLIIPDRKEKINEDSLENLLIKNKSNSSSQTNNDLSNKNNNSQIEVKSDLSNKNNNVLKIEGTNEQLNKIKSSSSLNNKNNDLSTKSNSLSKTNNDLNSISFSNEELTRIVLSLQKELSDMNKKFERLEKNQLLMYHQLQMYQSSRDIEKSINHFYYDYLFPRKISTNEFEKLQKIIEYMNNDDYSLLNKTQKIKLRKYFRFHFFANRVSNKILHRNFHENSKKILEEKRRNNDLLGLIPGFDYDECFDSLSFFVENNIKNEQLNKAMEIVYEKDYINDKGLKEIFDCDREVIRKNEDGIEILLNKNDIEEMRSYFKTIKLKDNDTSFVELCNNTIWDKGSKELI